MNPKESKGWGYMRDIRGKKLKEKNDTITFEFI